MSLSAKQCVPCRGGQPLAKAEAEKLAADVPGWKMDAEGKCITRRWSFKNFAQALAFINQVGGIAEAENHHPDIVFGWGYAELTLTTHDVGGLHENDFIIAAKINALPA